MQFIDIRSDTVTQPTQQMRDSILTAKYGDWAYGQDPTVIALQKKVAQLLGKEDSTFVPSGVFGNQSLLLSVGRPGDEVMIADKSHIVRYENGSIGMLSRMFARTLPSDQNGFLHPETLRKYVRKLKDSQAPSSTILCLQSPTCQGRIYPLQTLRQLIKIGKQNKMHVHLDGARLFHAVQVLNIDVKQMVSQFDSIMFCLSKGLGSPIGSMVVGTKSVIQKVRDNRKRLGGNLRKPGVIAQSCFISLDNRTIFIKKAHQSAQRLAQGLRKLDWIEIVGLVEINMIFFKFVNSKSDNQGTKTVLDIQQLKIRLLDNKIKCFLNAKYGQINRFVTHHYIGEKQVDKILSIFQNFYEQSVQAQSK